jgi:hypothetical protein
MGATGDFNYREKIEVIRTTEVPDGYGGYTKTMETIDTFYAKVDKLVYEYRDQQHLLYVDKGITFTSIYRIQTGTDLLFKINDVLYRLVKHVVQRRKFVYICEELM